MARRPRISGEGLYHHIYAWGNNRQAIFLVNEHYRRYLNLLEIYGREHRVDVVAYALMQSHIHLFVHDPAGTISQFMNSLHGGYALYFNRATGRIGHVFGERFNNRIVQANSYGLWLSRYIHRQAVEAGLVTDPVDYPWSSYHLYLQEAPSNFLKPEIILEQFGNIGDRTRLYKEFVLNTEHDPVDWNTTSAEVIGDSGFRQLVNCRIATGHKNKPDSDELVELIEIRFNIDLQLLIGACGLSERRLRRQVIRYLIGEAGAGRTEVARLLRVSPMAIYKALKEEV